jgi:hypothetical protein
MHTQQAVGPSGKSHVQPKRGAKALLNEDSDDFSPFQYVGQPGRGVHEPYGKPLRCAAAAARPLTASLWFIFPFVYLF